MTRGCVIRTTLAIGPVPATSVASWTADSPVSAVPAANVYPIVRDELGDVELAALACSWSTAAHMLHRVELRAGQRIAITGASGGVGTALVSLAALRGATVVAVAGAAKREPWRRSGPTPSWHEAPTTPRSGAAMPPAAHSTWWPTSSAAPTSAIGSTRCGGADATSRRGRSRGRSSSFDLRTLYLNDLELIGATVFEPQVFGDLVGLVNAGRVRPPVAATFPLDEIGAAQEMFGRKEHVGAIVITIA